MEIGRPAYLERLGIRESQISSALSQYPLTPI